jgi:hypothetical protein
MFKIIIKLQLYLLCCFCIVKPHNLPVSFLYIESHGWTNYHKGLLVDSLGEIKSFEFDYYDENISGRLTQFTKELPADMEIQILDLSVSTEKYVDDDLLIKLHELIDTIHDYKNDVTMDGPEDAGIYRLSAFVFDTVSSSRKEIVCYQFGESNYCNPSFAAREIASHLLSIFSLNISELGYHTTPDTCLNPTTIINLFHSKSTFIQKKPNSQYQMFDLNGKKVTNPSKQLYVAKHGKVLMDLKTKRSSKKQK